MDTITESQILIARDNLGPVFDIGYAFAEPLNMTDLRKRPRVRYQWRIGTSSGDPAIWYGGPSRSRCQ